MAGVGVTAAVAGGGGRGGGQRGGAPAIDMLPLVLSYF